MNKSKQRILAAFVIMLGMILSIIAACVYAHFEDWGMLGVMLTLCIINAVVLITALFHHEVLAKRFDKLEKLISELKGDHH